MKTIHFPAKVLPGRIIRTAACSALAAVLLLPAIATGQLDWLNKGKEVMDTLHQPAASKADTRLTTAEVAAGLKEALRVGSTRVVEKVGSVDGFNADPQIHIPLPENLRKVRSALATVGMGGMMDDLELQLNRAAEQAAGKARPLFLDAISTLTIEDAMEIYQGPDDAATRYFENRMSKPLAEEMRPVVAESLQDVGAIQTYEAALGKYKTLPFVPDVQADLTGYVVEQGMDGIFHYLAEEEAAIRADPVKRTTALLQKVFGSN